MTQPDSPSSAPDAKPDDDKPLESPMPRSPHMDKEEPEIASEDDIAPEQPKSGDPS